MKTNLEKIVVVGATGNIGSRVVSGLLAKGYIPRVIVQKVVSNTEWEKAGVEQTIADLADVESLKRAFDGADKVFSLVPFVPNLVELGQNLTAAASAVNIKYIVRSSAQGASLDSPVTLGRSHGELDKTLEDSEIDYTILQPATFFQNYLGHAGTIKNQNAFCLPLGAARVSLVDVSDIAATAVVALTESGHSRQKYLVTGGESLTNYEIAEIFTEVLGRKINYIDVPEDEARRQMRAANRPLWIVDVVLELNMIGRQGYFDETQPVVKKLTGSNPITFKQFVEANRSAY